MSTGGSTRYQRRRRRNVADRRRCRIRAGTRNSSYTATAAASTTAAIFDERRVGDDGWGQWTEQERDQLAEQRAQDGLVQDGDGAVVGPFEWILERRAEHVVQVHLGGDSYDLQKDKMVEDVRRVADRVPGVIVHGFHIVDASRPQQIDWYDDHERVLDPVDGGLQRQLPAVRLGEHERQEGPIQVIHLYPEEGGRTLLRLVTG